ncbi:MAG: tyrosine-protein kinase family protein, partial [Terriglobales bacterium]
SQLRAALAHFDLAERKLDALRQGYSGLLGQLQQAIAAAAFVTPDLRIGDAVRAGVKPASPRVGFTLAAALLLGLVFGLAGIWACERSDDRLWLPEAGELGVAVAATLPALPPGETAWAPKVRGALTSPRFSDAIEVCAAALLAAHREAGTSVVLLSSVSGGEGKTGLALPLAERLAQFAPVLVLDAHAARPALHHAYGGAPEPGLTELLTGEAEIEMVWHASQSGIAPSGAALSYISAGRVTSSGLTIPLTSGVVGSLLAGARARFDWIVVDGPPVLAGAEAGLWAGLADCTLLLTRYGTSSRREVRRCLDVLERSGAQGLALVVNGAPEHACTPPLELWRPQAAVKPAAESMRLRA